MIEEPTRVEYSSENPKLISRAALERIRDQLLAPMRTDPPTVSTYPRELDVELFRLFNISNLRIVRKMKSVTLGGRETRKPIEVWAYEVDGYDYDSEEDDGTGVTKYSTYGEVQGDGTWLAIPNVVEVPRYTENTDDACRFKGTILGIAGERRLVIEEIEDEYFPRWRAKIIDSSSQIAAEGETFDCAGSIVLAVVCDLIANDGASYWIKVTEQGK